ncbi:MAG TPA: DUF6496 domain-containing protein [Stellaceae bacterium]|jgi:hypothetical protein
MASHQSPAEKQTIERVMHEFKEGELKTARGTRKVKNPKQAIAIALSEAGASNRQDAATNARNRRRTKAKERRGETYEDEAEGRRATQKTYARATARSHRRTAAKGDGKTRADLYAEAKRRGVPGRSKMNKTELERALHG